MQHIDSQSIDIAAFERESGISNGYFRNTQKRGADITEKILDKIRHKQPKAYAAIFGHSTDHALKDDTVPYTAPQAVNTIDYHAKYIALLEKNDADKSAIINTIMNVLNRVDGNVTDIKANLDDAADKQQTFRTMTVARQQVMMETMAEMRGLPKVALLNIADSIGDALLHGSEQKNNS